MYSTLTGDLLRELQGHEGKVTDFKINPKNHLQVRTGSELDCGGFLSRELCAVQCSELISILSLRSLIIYTFL